MPDDTEKLRAMAASANHLGVLATSRRDGSVHASLVSAGVTTDPVSGSPAIGVVVAGSAVKLRHIRRAAHATITFQDGYRWMAADGPARIAGPEDPDGGVDAGDVPALLRAVFTAAGGTHDDWDEFDRVMATERRTAIFISPTRVLSVG